MNNIDRGQAGSCNFGKRLQQLALNERGTFQAELDRSSGVCCDTGRTAVSSGQPERCAPSRTAKKVLPVISRTTVSTAARSSRQRMLSGEWAERNAVDVPRFLSVRGNPARTGAARADDTPGTSSYSIPCSLSADISSLARENMETHPPFNLTTCGHPARYSPTLARPLCSRIACYFKLEEGLSRSNRIGLENRNKKSQKDRKKEKQG